MNTKGLEEAISVLLQIKRTLQKGGTVPTTSLIDKVDLCISKIVPFVNVFTRQSINNLENPVGEGLKTRSQIIDRSQERFSFDSSLYSEVRKSTNEEELLKVRNSFIRRESNAQGIDISPEKQPVTGSVLLDYFVLKYNLSLNQYIVFGQKNGPKTDRKVFVDLLTYDNKRLHVSKLQKTQSMTNVLKQIFSQSKPSQPFILPNCQQQQIRYLFVFSLAQCGSIAREYYRTETFCCFISRQFILGELMQLMNDISKICFEKQVYEASHAEQNLLANTISQLHGKKLYEQMENAIQNYLKQRDSPMKSKIQGSKISQFYLNSIDSYLQRGSVLWSTLKKGKDQKFIMTLVVLYYLTLSEYKIIIISKNQNKHLISELTLGLIRSLEPLTYVYPIVGTTITPHHFEFVNSPVPILVGFWGFEQDYQAVKTNLNKMLKAQKNMTKEQLATQTLLAVLDIEENTIHFLQSTYDQASYICQRIQQFFSSQTEQLISSKLSRLTAKLTQGYRSQDWMLSLAKNMKVTQMYDYFVSKK